MRGARVVMGLTVASLLYFPPKADASQALDHEVEPNDSLQTATPLGSSNLVVYGEMYAFDSYDYFSFAAQAGDRIYAAVMTSESPGAPDSALSIMNGSGNTIAFDDNDGCLGSTSSSIAGALIPTAGTYYVQVFSLGAAGLRPYHLHFQLHRGAPSAESEPNDAPSSADPLPASGWVSGNRGSSTDADWFELQLGSGDSVFLSLASGTSDGRLAFGMFGDAADQLLVGDGSSGDSEVSEALFATVKDAGTYYVRVDSASSATGPYTLSASVHHGGGGTSNCSTYTSSDIPKTIPAGGGLVSSTLFVPGHPRIADLNVALRLDHAAMPDLDAHLRSPAGNDDGLFNDAGSTSQTHMDLALDDEAAFPLGAFPPMKGLVVEPRSLYRLFWFDGEDAGGTWNLDLYDDTSNASGGTLLGWSLTICEAPPPSCQTPHYRADFEAGNAAGFTHAGTADEWSLGTPSGGSAPILGCNSGSGCFKTDLTGKYEANSSQNLDSPLISLPTTAGQRILVSWAQAYQMGDVQPSSGPGDFYYVEVLEAQTPARRIFEWTGPAMADFVGTPQVQIQESAGWGVQTADLTAYAGRDVRLRFHVETNATLNYAGVGIDDVSIALCCTPESCDDQNPCTADTCDPASGCSHAAVSGPCDDGNDCTIGDACSAGACASGPSVDCNDGNACTTDSCNATTGCVHAPVVCNDFNPCTNDTCVGSTGCVYTALNGNPCDADGNACTADHCVGATCTAGPPADCDDHDPCTTDGCNVATGCTHAPIPCSDGDPCTADSCDAAQGCVHTQADLPCDDGDACTSGDHCVNGACTPGSQTPSCDDGIACTVDSCASPSGCVHTPNNAVCPSGECFAGFCNPSTGCTNAIHYDQPCTGGNACHHGRCFSESCTILFTENCGYPFNCGQSTCNPATGQCVISNPDPCDDHIACTIDSCNGGGACVHSVPAACDDQDACTTDGCGANGACSHAPIDCRDANPCTLDSCSAGTCSHAAAPPREIANLRVSKSFVTWDPDPEQLASTTYQVVRGVLPALPVGSVPEFCLETETSGAGVQESTVPFVGEGFWYLVRAKHACGVGTYGYAGLHGSPAAERVTSACP